MKLRPFWIGPMWAAIVSCMAATAAAAPFAASQWSAIDQAQVRLIAGRTAVGDGSALSMGLQFRLAPGWKIYWRSPGDAGYPPRLDWAQSSNLERVQVSWPAPIRISAPGGIETVGYKGEVILPLAVTPQRAGEALRLRAGLDYQICENVCIPVRTALAMEIPAGAAGSSRFAPEIARFAALVPGGDGSNGITIERADIIDKGDGGILEVAVRAAVPFVAPDVFVEGYADAGFAAPRVSLQDGGRRAVLRLATEAGSAELAGRPLTLTLVDHRSEAAPAAVTHTLVVAKGAAETGILMILLLAVLGGLILNVMPCVLPVLSIKLLHVVNLGGAERRRIRASFLATAAGVIASFLVLAAGAWGLKAGGVAVGWGMHFQEPLFLVALIVILGLFAANLWGLFEVGLPSWLANAGSGSAAGGGNGGAFLTGALATLMATPCSAPFLGTAVGFALAGGTLDIFAIFLALGLGMALPYLVVAARPGLAGRLPRPGQWMIVLRQVLGLLLIGTALWLLFILQRQSGSTAALMVSWLVLAMAFALAMRHRAAGAGKRVAGALVALLLVAAALAPGRLGVPPAAAVAADSGEKVAWQPFDRGAIRALVAAGNLVFVDVTAEWCVTCLVNKGLVIDRDPVRTRLSADNVVTMQADWTLPDARISDYLKSFGRYGIPFNAVYGPAAPGGVVLPELLTDSAVLAAMARAAGTISTAALDR